MSKESWLFLFAALGGIGGFGTIIGLALQIRQKMTSVVKPGKTTPLKVNQSSVLLSRSRLMLVLVLLIFSAVLSGVGFVASLRSQDALRDELGPDKIEGTLKQWFVGLGYNISDLPASSSDVEFAFTATQLPGHPVQIIRQKQLEGFISVQGEVTISEQHQKIIDKLPQEKIREINHDLTIELSRVGSDYVQMGLTPLHVVVFRRLVPITNSLSPSTVIIAAIAAVAEENLVVEIVLRDIGQ